MALPEPPTLLNIALELRQKILAYVLNDKILVRNYIVLHMYDNADKLALLDADDIADPKVEAPCFHKRAKNLSAVHPKLAEAVPFVLKSALDAFDVESKRVLLLAVNYFGPKSYDPYHELKYIAVGILQYGIPESSRHLSDIMINFWRDFRMQAIGMVWIDVYRILIGSQQIKKLRKELGDECQDVATKEDFSSDGDSEGSAYGSTEERGQEEEED
jgi:hypothetical protein